MCAGPKYEYRWADGVKVKKPIECSAPKYVDFLLEWVELQVDDEALFPQAPAVPFPKNFPDVVRKIFTRLFRVYAHIYHSHFQEICALGAEAHLNTCFKHFIYFTGAFGLVKREEQAPLGELVDGIMGVGGGGGGGGDGGGGGGGGLSRGRMGVGVSGVGGVNPASVGSSVGSNSFGGNSGNWS